MLQERNLTSFAEVMVGAQASEALGTILYSQERSYLGEQSTQDLTIRLADTRSERRLASSIVSRLYDSVGYGSDHQVAESHDSVTFTASSGGERVGTLTLAVDAQAKMALDTTFGVELRQFRSQSNTRLCELTKFAFNPSPQSRPLLAKLFHVIFIYGTLKFDCTDLLIEVDPRHICFYETMLKFSRVGPLRTNPIFDAPGQLMHLKVADIRENIEAHVGSRNRSGRSLYKYFFDWAEEEQLRAHIEGLTDEDAFSSRTCIASELATLLQQPAFRAN